jgi:hypothetical protein
MHTEPAISSRYTLIYLFIYDLSASMPTESNRNLMVTSLSADNERSKWNPIDRADSWTKTARSRVQTWTGKDQIEWNSRLQDGRTWWEMWVSEKRNVHGDATASIARGMTNRIQSLRAGLREARREARQVNKLLAATCRVWPLTFLKFDAR